MIQEKIKVSGLLPVYYNTNIFYLKEAIKSLLVQTEALEEIVIVVDGPCSPELREFLKKLDKSTFRIFYQKKNLGLASTLHFGVKKCRFEYILRMDDDDISNIDRLKLQKDFLKNHPEIDVLGSQIKEVSEDLTEVFSFRNCPMTHEEICETLPYKNSINHVTVVFKKSSVLKAGNYAKNTSGFEDYELWQRMKKYGFRFANLNYPLVFVRFDDKQISTRSGFRAFIREIRMQNIFHKAGHISWKRYTINLFIRALPRLLPKAIFTHFIKITSRN